MADKDTERAFNVALQERMTELRGERSRREIAEAIGTTFARYQKYETRSACPPYLIPRLAKLHGVSVEYMLTGKEQSIREVIEESAHAAIEIADGRFLSPAAISELADAIAEALARQQGAHRPDSHPPTGAPNSKGARKE
jgi:hypothetical protein